jgi:hypothetical protein
MVFTPRTRHTHLDLLKFGGFRPKRLARMTASGRDSPFAIGKFRPKAVIRRWKLRCQLWKLHMTDVVTSGNKNVLESSVLAAC